MVDTSQLIRLSVVIPTLNEHAALRALLHDLAQQRGVVLQCIVADGGSSDDTRGSAQAGGALWLDAPRGRGAQMNAGRQHAEHEYLLFLHADSRLPQPTMVQQALHAIIAAPARTAGHFALRFVDTAPSARRFYQHLEGKSRLNRPETIHGDQGLLLSRRFFDELGGFDEQLPFFEDHAISQRIFEHGRWRLLPGRLHTSARRFEQEGRRARYFLMMLMMCARHAKLDSFFQQAPRLYPPAGQSEQLKVAPFLQLIIQLAEQQPDFWHAMARYALDNAWQPFFWLDQWLGRPWLLPLHDRLAPYWPRFLLVPLLARTLKPLFSGPILHAIQQREKH